MYIHIYIYIWICMYVIHKHASDTRKYGLGRNIHRHLGSTLYSSCSIFCSRCAFAWLCGSKRHAGRAVFTITKVSVLQCVAVCCSVLQCAAVFCSVLQCAVVCCCSMLQCVAVCCSVLQCFAMCCSVLQCAAACVAVCCSVLQCVAYTCVHHSQGQLEVDRCSLCQLAMSARDIALYDAQHIVRENTLDQFMKIPRAQNASSWQIMVRWATYSWLHNIVSIHDNTSGSQHQFVIIILQEHHRVRDNKLFQFMKTRGAPNVSSWLLSLLYCKILPLHTSSTTVVVSHHCNTPATHLQHTATHCNTLLQVHVKAATCCHIYTYIYIYIYI